MKKSSFIILTSVLCAVSSVFTAVCAFFITRAFMPTPAFENESNTVAVSGDGEEFINGGIYNMPQTLSFSGNVMPLADTSANSVESGEITLTATVTPANAVITLNWSVAFANPSSSWATGKNAASYIDVQPVVGTLQAKVSCKAAFGEQIIITAAAANDSTKKATCTCDYVKRATSVSMTFSENSAIDGYRTFYFKESGLTSESTFSGGKSLDSNASCTEGIGTVSDTYEVTELKLRVGAAFATYLDLLFAGKSAPDIISSIKTGDYKPYTVLSTGYYEFCDFTSAYSLFKLICGEVTEDEQSDVRRIAIAINDDLSGNVDSSGKAVPKNINGLTLIYTVKGAKCGTFTVSVPVAYKYARTFPTANAQSVSLTKTSLTF